MKKVVCQSKNNAATKQLGIDLTKKLLCGGVILLRGELGAGKTTFVQGLAKGLGITQAVTSPTFTIMNVYVTNHPAIQTLIHVDLYRLTTTDRLTELDLPTLQQDPKTLLVIEWPERAPTELWFNLLGTIQFGLTDDANERHLEITGALAQLFKK